MFSHTHINVCDSHEYYIAASGDLSRAALFTRKYLLIPPARGVLV